MIEDYRICCRTLKAAVNDLGSCSGHLLVAWFLGPDVFSEVAARGLLLTGSHRASTAAVAEAKADFAAIGLTISLSLSSFESWGAIQYSPENCPKNCP